MIKLNILNMKNFLATVNACKGEVRLLCPDGKKTNINGEKTLQNRLWEQYLRNKKQLQLVLEIPAPKDYLHILSYYAGDC